MIRIKRIYDGSSKSDGYRILVDGLWPRGMSKEKAGIDEWLKEVAPSTKLRQWYNHDPDRFSEFKERYWAELSDNPALKKLEYQINSHETVTLLYASKSPLNEAAVLQEYLQNKS